MKWLLVGVVIIGLLFVGCSQQEQEECICPNETKLVQSIEQEREMKENYREAFFKLKNQIEVVEGYDVEYEINETINGSKFHPKSGGRYSIEHVAISTGAVSGFKLNKERFPNNSLNNILVDSPITIDYFSNCSIVNQYYNGTVFKCDNDPVFPPYTVDYPELNETQTHYVKRIAELEHKIAELKYYDNNTGGKTTWNDSVTSD